MNYKPGDRVVCLPRAEARDKPWERHFTLGSVHALTDVWLESAGPKGERYWSVDTTEEFAIPESEFMLESVYNSKLYKLLNEEQ